MFKIKKSTLSSYLMTFALTILSLNYICYQTYGFDSIKNVLRIIAIGLIIVSGLLDKINFSKFDLLSIFIIIVTFISSGFSTVNFVVTFLILISSKRYNVQQFAHFAYIGSLISLIFYFIGVFVEKISLQVYFSGNRLRNTLGFSNVNAGSMFFLSFIMLWIAEKPSKFRWAVGSISSMVLYYLTDTRTTLISYIVFLLLVLLFFTAEKFKKFEKIAYKTLNCMVSVAIFVAIMTTFFAKNIKIIFPFVDKLLSGRLSIFSKVMEGISFKQFLFGGGSQEVDNSYINICVNGGFLLLILILVLIIHAINNDSTYRKQNLIFLAILYSISLAGTMEGILMRPEILISVVVFKFAYDILQGKNDIS